MYAKNDKRRLYWLIDQYISGKIAAPAFCDEFYYSYDLELNHKALTEPEQQVFEELSKVSGRFSPHKEDHKADARAFSTLQELKQKIAETKEKLKQQGSVESE
jgi:hypothetical protein